MSDDIDERRAMLIALSEAKPTTVFEQIAAEIEVEVVHHNGGIRRKVTLFEVLKYPNSFYIPDGIKVFNEPAHAPTWKDGQFLLGPFR